MGPAKSDGNYDVKSKLYCCMSGFTFFPPLEVMVTVHVPRFESAVIDESSTEQVVLLTVGVSPDPRLTLNGVATPSTRAGAERLVTRLPSTMTLMVRCDAYCFKPGCSRGRLPIWWWRRVA